jgi:hypothetical protein
MLVLIIVSIKLNGVIADWEDRPPGGFLGPPPDEDRDARP